MNARWRKVDACRLCGGSNLSLVLDLGNTPLANSLLDAEDPGEARKYPLTLLRCRECALVQIGQVVDPEDLFADYVYFSSFSDTMLRHSRALAEQLVEGRGLSGSSLVVEIASNDGYLLQFFKERGVPVLGIEPAANIARVARDRGIPTLSRFFGSAMATELADAGTLADVLIGNNVLAHVPDLKDFVDGVRLVLRSDGAGIFEFPYLKEMLDKTEFDTIYHEHQSYFSASAVDRLFERHGLRLYDVERLNIHGGSLRAFVSRAEGAKRTARLTRLLEEEHEWGVDTGAPYEAFARRVGGVKARLRTLLFELKHDGARMAAYGASAKGVTLLTYCGIGPDELEFVVDRSTYKQGRRHPVGRMPIKAPDALQSERPDYALLLTWNFADEILEQQAAFRSAGGKFIVPIPDPHVV